jgi:hypothetical protein
MIVGLPTSSIVTSAPQLSASCLTRSTRASGVGYSRRSTNSSAPNSLANSSRSSTPSMTITFAAPISRATAQA